MTKPVSLFELSLHVTMTAVEETAVATISVGTFGIVSFDSNGISVGVNVGVGVDNKCESVVAETGKAGEGPAQLYDRTRYKYVVDGEGVRSSKDFVSFPVRPTSLHDSVEDEDKVRSILKPSSLFDWSIHDKPTLFEVTELTATLPAKTGGEPGSHVV